MLDKKGIQLSGSVIFGVVQDEKNRPMSKLEQITKKLMKGLGIESRSCLGHQLARCQIYCSKETNLLSSRSRKYTGLLSSGSPSAGESTGSLKMNFVFCPYLDPEIFYPFLEFFLNAFCFSGSALAACRRGLCRVKPKRWRTFWHCLTRKWTEYCFSR